MHCYCSICRKTAGGGGYAINLGGEAETLSVKGKRSLKVYRARLEDGSESPAERRFCGRCGSALWVWDPRWPALIHPFASAIDSALPAPPERCHIMVEYAPGLGQDPVGQAGPAFSRVSGSVARGLASEPRSPRPVMVQVPIGRLLGIRTPWHGKPTARGKRMTSQGTQGGTVKALWRYPVKSMAGTKLDEPLVTEGGILGDRAYAVIDRASGRVGSAKTPKKWVGLMTLAAEFMRPPEAGAPPPPVRIVWPDGATVTSDGGDADSRLSETLGRPVTLTTERPEAPSLERLDPLAAEETIVDIGELMMAGRFSDYAGAPPHDHGNPRAACRASPGIDVQCPALPSQCDDRTARGGERLRRERLGRARDRDWR